MKRWIRESLRRYAEKDGRGYPDWATRYVPIARGLQHRVPGQARILEIGANENSFARFSGRPVVALDFSERQLRAARRVTGGMCVRGNIARLPFASAVFDAVVCVDTFEHLPPGARPSAAAEVLRVLRPTGWAVVAFPSGEGARQAEERIRRAYQVYTGRTLDWFEEHKALGLPDTPALARLFRELGGGRRTLEIVPNCSLWMWEWMWQVLLCGWPGRGNVFFQALLRAMTPLLARLHHPPCYRTVFWIGPV